MLVLGIDPGVTTGIALYDDESSSVVYAKDVQSPVIVYEVLQTFLEETVTDKAIIIESYVGAGPRTQEAVHTIKMVGFVEFLCQSWGLTLFSQAPQQRKHQLATRRAVIA